MGLALVLDVLVTRAHDRPTLAALAGRPAGPPYPAKNERPGQR